jgi:hypothetical protein
MHRSVRGAPSVDHGVHDDTRHDREPSNDDPPRAICDLGRTDVQTVQAIADPRPMMAVAMSELGSMLFQVIAIVVLGALVWSLPERSREERRRRTAGVRSPHW